MDYRQKFAVEPGTKVRLSKIDASYIGKHETHEKALPEIQVSVERIMGCGLGGCYSCVVPMRNEDGRPHHVRSCLAGPVLAADQIVWD